MAYITSVGAEFPAALPSIVVALDDETNTQQAGEYQAQAEDHNKLGREIRAICEQLGISLANVVKTFDHTTAAHNALGIDAVTVGGMASGAFSLTGHSHLTLANKLTVGSADAADQYLDVVGALDSASFPYNLVSRDTASMASGVGGGIGFQGNDGTSLGRAFAAIHGGKSNGTSGNYDAYLDLLVRQNGGGLVSGLCINADRTFTTVASALPWASVNKTGSSLADLATRAVANLSDGSNVGLLNAANPFTGANTMATPGYPLSLSGTLYQVGGLDIRPLATPAAPTVTPQGVAGSTTYSYTVVAISRSGVGNSNTLAGPAGSTTTGNATLDANNFNRLTWTAIPGAYQYFIYRTVASGTPSSTGKIATVNGPTVTLDDTGLVGSGAASTVDFSGALSLGATKKLQVIGDYLGSGDLPAGVYFSCTGASSNISFVPNNGGTAGSKFVFAYFNGSGWKSAVEFANVASGYSPLTLQKNGGNTLIGANGALTTTATDGFLYIPSCAGAPSGTPTAYTGKTALVYDSTNNLLYANDGGGWVAANSP